MNPDYYQTHPRDYFEKTFSVDPAPFLDPFQQHLPRGAKILDVGCGSGRDLLWLKKRGFDVVGLERSAGLADLARQHSGCDVLIGDFETFDFAALDMDAVLMSGSLVHLPHAKLPAVLARILSACGHNSQTLHRPSSNMRKYAYISIKEGLATKGLADGRLFYLWEKKTMQPVLEGLGLNILEIRRSVSALRPDDVWLAFIAAF